MLVANIVDRINTKVNVWTKDGNFMEGRLLATVDEFGIVVTGWNDDDKLVFVPWVQVKYVDYPRGEQV